MDAVEFLKAWKRMCDSTSELDGLHNCEKCIWGGARSWAGTCQKDMVDEPEEAVAIAQKWAEEHPVKTMLMDFFEKFPKAERELSGLPTNCPDTLYGVDQMCIEADMPCFKCWNRPLEEEK